VYFNTILLIILVFGLFYTSISVYGTVNDNSSKNYTDYVNNEKGIQLKYPSEWNKFVKGLPQSGENETVVIFTSPSPVVNVAIAIDKLTANTTLEKFVKEKIENEIQQPSTLNFKIVESIPIILDKKNAYKLTMSATIDTYMGNITVLTTHAFTIVNDRVYEIVYVANPNDYNTYWSKVQNILNSFKIINSQQ
jgi:hypothetical protein